MATAWTPRSSTTRPWCATTSPSSRARKPPSKHRAEGGGPVRCISQGHERRSSPSPREGGVGRGEFQENRPSSPLPRREARERFELPDPTPNAERERRSARFARLFALFDVRPCRRRRRSGRHVLDLRVLLQVIEHLLAQDLLVKLRDAIALLQFLGKLVRGHLVRLR